MEPTSKTLELVPSEHITAERTFSKGPEENMKVGHTGLRSNLDGIYRSHDEGFKVTLSRS